jgi:hypothetical protein
MKGHGNVQPPKLKLTYNHNLLMQEGEMEKINAIHIDAPGFTGEQIVLIKTIVYLHSQNKNNKLLVYRRGDDDPTHGIRQLVADQHDVGFLGYHKKRKRDGGPTRRVISLDNNCGENTHFPSVTHIIALGHHRRPQREVEFHNFVARATRYGLLVAKPIVLIELDKWRHQNNFIELD